MSRFRLDPAARLHVGPDAGLLVGGQPLRVLRLNAAATAVVRRWRDGERSVRGVDQGLAARLHTAGLGVLRPGAPGASPAQVTVVVPVRDRVADLDRCLAGVAPCARLLVVDDASADRAGVADVAARHGAELLRRNHRGGPAAARNTGLRVVTTPLVAFVDSDCVLPQGWLPHLLEGLDADTSLVAPRIVGSGGDGWLARFEVGSSPLDLGVRSAPVFAGSRVGYLPAAVLLARTSDLGAGFDERMRVGEDVDLVWRLVAAGRQVRYDPQVVVGHRTRARLRDWVAQRVEYGRSAALLDMRHPGQAAPVVVSRWSLPALLCLAARRPIGVAACTLASAAGLWTQLPQAPGRTRETVQLTVTGLGWTVLGLLDAAARPWLPELLAVALVSRRVRALGLACVGVRLVRHRRTRTAGVPLPAWAALRVADDLAYAVGVWIGAFQHRRLGVLLPDLR